MTAVHELKRFWTLYAQRKILAILCLGIASGLPLSLVFSTLSAWLYEEGISKSAIGIFALLTIPYTLKFLWAPWIDGVRIPVLSKRLGLRRSWLLLTQIGLMVAIIALAFSNPAEAIYMTAFCAFGISVMSASQDIVIDAYRVELLDRDSQGAGAATIVFGYRVGMLISSGGALLLADQLGWSMTYVIMAMIIVIGFIAALVIGEPEHAPRGSSDEVTSFITEYVVQPLKEFMSRPYWKMILAFIIFYKFGDAFAGIMTTPFLLEIGFTKTQLGVMVKGFGFSALMVGSFLGGYMVYRLHLLTCLWICGLLQMVSNGMFIVQALYGNDVMVLGFTIGIENLTSGMGTAAFVAFISCLCHRNYTATQYALLSSLASVGRTVLSSPSGLAVDEVGWISFFALTIILAIPGLILLWIMRKKGVEIN